VAIALAGEALLSLLPLKLKEQLAAIGQRTSYADGELIHSRGDPAPRMGIVIRGRVRLCRLHASGAQTYVSVVRPGQHYGDVVMFGSNQRRTHDALAIGNAVVDHYDAQAFTRLLDTPAIMKALYQIASQRLIGAMGMNDDLRNLPRDVHLAKMLLVLSRQSADGASLQLVQEDLAALLGTTPMTISKALASLKASGLVETGYRQVRIVDHARLKAWLAERIDG
jgi:CRP/FNR family transcriptional regulator, cyclic AMP receptor protein